MVSGVRRTWPKEGLRLLEDRTLRFHPLKLDRGCADVLIAITRQCFTTA